MIFIGSDHGGWNLKEELKKWLKAKKFKFQDMGPKVLVQDDDYPDYCLPLARKVVRAKANSGILIGRSGIGMSICANKVKKVRAALCTAVGQAITARAHNNANIVVLAADLTKPEQAIKILDTFLQTQFSGEERHQRRNKKAEK